MKVFALIMFLTTSFMAFAESKFDTINSDTIFNLTVTPDYEIIKSYQEILEKTNQQLSLWWNPYILIISMLSIFFTVMAIITAIVIFRQSRESRRLMEESLFKHQLTLENLVDEKQKQLKLYESNVDNLILETKNKLSAVGVDQKKELEGLISKLELQ